MAQYTKKGYRSSSSQRFGDFRGLDLYDSPLIANPSRAIDAENFYVRGGEMHKRDGWEEVLDFSQITGDTAPIHGIFPYQNGEESFFIVHAGNHFYRVQRAESADYYTYEDVTDSGVGSAKVRTEDLFESDGEYRTQGFIREDKLYIVGAGKYLVFGKFFGDLVTPTIDPEAEDHEEYSGNNKVFDNADKLRAHECDPKIGDYAIVYIGSEQFCKYSNHINNTGSQYEWVFEGDHRNERIPAAESHGILFHIYRYSGSEWVMKEGIDAADIADAISVENQYELRYVSESQDTTVPTMGIGIEVSAEQTYARSALDDASVVTTRRMDTAHAGFQETGTEYRRVYTSQKIAENSHVRVTVHYKAGHGGGSDRPLEDYFVVFENGKNQSGEYGAILYVVDGLLVKCNRLEHKVIGDNNSDYTFYGIDYSQMNARSSPSNPIRAATVNFSDGYINFGRYRCDLGSLADVISVFYTELEEDNIQVEYIAADAETPIDRCRFGTTFDIDGGTRRLFLSGNDEKKNIDWYSGLDDYTYFGDLSSAVYGYAETPVTGYVQLGNSTLAVFKDAMNGESSVYYRSGNYISEDETNSRVVFSLTNGAIGKYALNPSVAWNFGDDSLFLAKDCVYGIVMTEKFKYDDRYAKERGRTVTPQIEKAVLAGANPTGIVKDEKLYISLGDKDDTVLVCDARQKFVSEDSVDGAYQYEWYRYTGVPAFVFTNSDDVLWFGTRSGKLARIREGKFYDRTIKRGEPGDFTLNFETSKFSYSVASYSDLEDGTPLAFGILGSAPMCLYAHLCSAHELLANGYISVEADPGSVYGRVYEGLTVYVRDAGESGLEGIYTMRNITIGTTGYTFRLYNGSSIVTPLSADFSLSEKLCYDYPEGGNLGSPAVVYVANLDSENGTFQIRRFLEGPVLEFFETENDGFSSALFDVLDDKPVKAHWITPYTSLGSNIIDKTLFSLTVCPELHSRGNLTFGYETRHKREALELVQSVNLLQANPLSLDTLNFHSFTLETGFAEARTFRVKERNFNYIRFRFSSDDASDCGINNFTIMFKVIKQYRGIS